MTQLRHLSFALLHGTVLVATVLMVWEARWHYTFDSFFKRPVRDYVELSYIAVAIPGAIVLFGRAIFRLIGGHGSLAVRILTVLLTFSLCLLLGFCCVWMAVRVAI